MWLLLYVVLCVVVSFLNKNPNHAHNWIQLNGNRHCFHLELPARSLHTCIERGEVCVYIPTLNTQRADNIPPISLSARCAAIHNKGNNNIFVYNIQFIVRLFLFAIRLLHASHDTVREVNCLWYTYSLLAMFYNFLDVILLFMCVECYIIYDLRNSIYINEFVFLSAVERGSAHPSSNISNSSNHSTS